MSALTSANRLDVTTQWGTVAEGTLPAIVVNDTPFVLLAKPMHDVSLDLDLSDYNVIVLALLTAETSLTLRGAHVILLTAPNTKEGPLLIQAAKKAIQVGTALTDIAHTQGHYQVDHSEAVRDDFLSALTLEGEAGGSLFIATLVELFALITDPEGHNPTIDLQAALTFFQ